MRENLLKQVFEVSLYRKLVIWNDLNIQPDEYCPQKVVDRLNQINNFQETLGYVPTRLEFEEINLDTPGFFSFLENTGNIAESTDTLDAQTGSLIEMENLIKKNFMMPPEKLKEYANNNPKQKTLRDQVEELTLELNETASKYKKMSELFYNKSKESDNSNLQD